MWQNLQFPVDLATFTEEIFNGKLHILCSKLLHRLWLKKIKVESSTLRRNCPYLDLFWSLLSRIQIEYGKVLCISPYSVRMRENTDQNNFKYGDFLRSENSKWHKKLTSWYPGTFIFLPCSSVLNAIPVTNPFLIWTLFDICCFFWRYSRKTCRSVLLKILTFQFQFELYFHLLGRFININFS